MNLCNLKVTAWHECHFCTATTGLRVPIITECVPIDLDDTTGQEISDAIDDQKQADGWGYDNSYCPDCMETKGAIINAIETADDKDEEGVR